MDKLHSRVQGCFFLSEMVLAGHLLLALSRVKGRSLGCVTPSRASPGGRRLRLSRSGIIWGLGNAGVAGSVGRGAVFRRACRVWSDAPIPTRQSEAVREGWEDYQLLSLLRERGRDEDIAALIRDYEEGKALGELRLRALRLAAALPR